MDCETGRITANDSDEVVDALAKALQIPVSKDDMTKKQFENMQVSTHDTRSKLGKVRRNTYNNLRNKPCVCGSGVKFKKCCWSKMQIARNDQIVGNRNIKNEY